MATPMPQRVAMARGNVAVERCGREQALRDLVSSTRRLVLAEDKLRRLQREHRLAGDCEECHGEGYVEINPSWRNDPQCVVDTLCPRCGGSGLGAK